MRQILDRLEDRFSPGAIGHWLAAKLPSLITAVLVLVIFWACTSQLEEAAAS